MWQLYALGSLLTNSLGSVADKNALIADRSIDYAVATLWRLVLYVACVTAIGLTGVLGALQFAFPPEILALGVLSIISSLFYTYLLRHIEITSYVGFAYLAPFVFLLVDTLILREKLGSSEIFGIVLLVIGGLGFAIDGKTHQFKKELSPYALLMIVFSIIQMGAQAYLFKHLHGTTGMSGVSFFASADLLAAAGVLSLIAMQGKLGLLWTRPARTYVPRVAFSKMCDALTTLLWAQALLFAAVSQVSAIGALQPLVVFILTIIGQRIFGLRIGEKFGLPRMKWKAMTISLLIVGGLLVG
ncbi:hypothetical protein HY417_01590 [Candidatus Kaiserbacteria bacterium]|nr:hypothetical protein [Candidatus Kaiserbacteria bacterium]